MALSEPTRPARLLDRTAVELRDALAAGELSAREVTRAALDGACKYPWTKTNPDGTTNRKYGAYDEDAHLLDWLREGHTDNRKCIEAQVMDWSDDIAYSVHDVEDGIISRRISLNVLWDLVELAQLAEKGAKAFGGTADELDAVLHSAVRRLAVAMDAFGRGEDLGPIRERGADEALAADVAFIPLARPFRWALVAQRLRAWQPNDRAWHPLNLLRRAPN